MGMSSSETVLEQFMCPVIGGLLEDVVAKLADNLFSGDENINDLFLYNV